MQATLLQPSAARDALALGCKGRSATPLLEMVKEVGEAVRERIRFRATALSELVLERFRQSKAMKDAIRVLETMSNWEKGGKAKMAIARYTKDNTKENTDMKGKMDNKMAKKETTNEKSDEMKKGTKITAEEERDKKRRERIPTNPGAHDEVPRRVFHDYGSETTRAHRGCP